MPLERELQVAAFAGSTRRDSLNQQLLDAASETVRVSGAAVDSISLAEFPMPLYHGDLQVEKGIPTSTAAFAARLESADALLVASPEYNGGYTPLLKNAIDWATRIDRDVFESKVVALLSASPGSRGGVRGLAQIEQILINLRATVLKPSFSVGRSREKFVDGRLVDLDVATELERWVKEFVRSAAAHAGDPLKSNGRGGT